MLKKLLLNSGLGVDFNIFLRTVIIFTSDKKHYFVGLSLSQCYSRS